MPISIETRVTKLLSHIINCEFWVVVMGMCAAAILSIDISSYIVLQRRSNSNACSLAAHRVSEYGFQYRVEKNSSNVFAAMGSDGKVGNSPLAASCRSSTTDPGRPNRLHKVATLISFD